MSESSVPRIKLRVENLSDLVFGLALSIGSIVLISKLPQSPTALVTGILLFGASFLLVVWIWSGYTRTMAALPYEVRGSFLLNIALLFCVAVEPYLFYLLSDVQLSLLGFASSVYALDVGAMLFILAGLGLIVLKEDKRRGSPARPQGSVKRFARSLSLSTGGAVFVVSALPFFWTAVEVGQYLRFDMWYAAMAILFFAPRLGR